MKGFLPPSVIHYHFIYIGHDRFWNRFLEIIPALSIFLTLFAPLFLSFYHPLWVAIFIIIYDLLWLFRAGKYAYHLIRGYHLLKFTEHRDWAKECKKLSSPHIYLNYLMSEKEKIKKNYPLIKIPALRRIFIKQDVIQNYKFLKEKIIELEDFIRHEKKFKDYRKIYHLLILATYKEELEVLRQSIKSLVGTYPKEKMIFVLATEERDKERASRNAYLLKKELGKDFGLFLSTMHPANLPGEVKGKGANITYAAKKVLPIIKEKKINFEDVIVTTLDADTCVHPQYLWKLTYEYILKPDRTYASFQPIPIYANNIWDVPPPLSIVSISCSFWQIIQSSRPHLLRNFSVHAQSLKTLIDTDFWSTQTIVEDGHQFWRTFMRYNGHHDVVPLFVPVYQDAVLGHTFWQTVRNQYLQLRRWAWGVTDFPYVIKNFLINKKIPLWQKILEAWRAFEGTFSLATAPLVITFVAWMPIFLNPSFKEYNIMAINLPLICGGLLTFSTVGLVISAICSALLVPSPPPFSQYRKKNKIILVLEWIFLPLFSIFFSSLPAVDAQIKLALGRYMEIPGFFVVEKVRKENKKID